MIIKIKKPLTKDKLDKAEKQMAEKQGKSKGFNAKKFSGKLKGVLDDTSAIKKQEILRDLEEIPVERLDEIEKFLKNILTQFSVRKSKEPKTLKGIWAKKGFEKIVDLEADIIEIRGELDSQVLKRKL